MRRVLSGLFLLVLAVGLLCSSAALWWLNAPLTLQPLRGSQVVDLEIEPGTRGRELAQVVVASGVQTSANWLYGWFRLSGQSRQIRAGSYEVTPGTTPRSLLRMLVRGEETLKTISLPEGWSFKQVLTALQSAEQLRSDTQGMSAEAIMAKIGKPGVHPEGRFFPDTYTYAKGSSAARTHRCNRQSRL